MKRHRHLKGGFPTGVSSQTLTTHPEARRPNLVEMCPLAVCALLLIVTGLPMFAADVNSTWNGGAANWSDAANWTPNTFYPKNGNGGFTFNASVVSGTASLTENIQIHGLSFSGGTLLGDFDLFLNQPLSWTGGTLGGVGLSLIHI